MRGGQSLRTSLRSVGIPKFEACVVRGCDGKERQTPNSFIAQLCKHACDECDFCECDVN